jgi:hypothetical protein
MRIIKIIITLLALILSYQSVAQELPVGRYSDAAISNGFKNGIIFSFSGNAKDNSGDQMTILFSGETKPGVLARFKGKSFLKVVNDVYMSAGSTNIKSQHVSYMDPASLKEIYSINLEDGEITTVDHFHDYPEYMNVGDTIELKKTTTASDKNSKNIISKSHSSLTLVPLDGKEGFFEFCENEAIYKSEDNFKEVSDSFSTCVIMDEEGKKFGAFIDVDVAGISARLTGTIEQK